MEENQLQAIMGDYDMIGFLMRCKLDFKFFCEKVLYDFFTEEYGGLKPYMLEWFVAIQNNNRVIRN